MLERVAGPVGLVLFGTLACMTLAGVTAFAQRAEAEPSLLDRGLEVYLEQRCGLCHAYSPAGTSGTFGPGHDGAPVIAAARVADPSYSGSATDAASYLRESILEPAAYTVPGYAGTYHRMPAYTFLDEADIDALVALLLHDPSAPPGGEGRE